MNVSFHRAVSNCKVALLGVLVCGMLFAVPAQAKSQCSGLSNSKCASNSSCTWRKASVDKNGKKTKAHCRALPGQAKKTATKLKKKAAATTPTANSNAAKKVNKKKLKKKDKS